MRCLYPLLLLAGCAAPAAESTPVSAPRLATSAELLSRWGRDLDRTNPLPAHPRPTLVRERWRSLNGPWQFEFGNPTQPPPFGRQLAGEILVPFAPESRLSGVEDHQPHLWYRRFLEVPTGWRRDRVLLHFGAVDWEAEVWVNGRPLALHQGGYEPFSVDITAALLPVPEQELIVRVLDPTEAGEQMRGEQSVAPGPGPHPSVSGIWQTVWMEPVPRRGIDELLIEPDLESGSVAVTVGGIDPLGGDQVEVEVLERGGLLAARRGAVGERLLVPIPAPRAWSPEDPFLYDLRVIRTGAEGKVIERVHSYFGLRTVGRVTDAGGLTRITINGEPRFLMGVLDRGLWPGGIYTPPGDEAMRMDLATAKSMGFDLIRKHAKVEPERWYAWCDRLGLLVWQDIPMAAPRTEEGRSGFELELDALVAARRQHPSIIGWVLADQGQDQLDASRICAELQAVDPGRLVARSSSWLTTAQGAVADAGHSFETVGPGATGSDTRNLPVLGQYGGVTLPIEGHAPPDPWGYQPAGTWVADADELAFAYDDQARKVWGLAEEGLAAAFYAQLTDVESSASGLMTYDRELIKLPLEGLAQANKGRFAPLYLLLPTAESGGRSWRYRTVEPEGDWLKVYGEALVLPGDEEGWLEGAGGFGMEEPGMLLRTPWNTPEIWMVSDLKLPALPAGELVLRLLHGDQVTVWINGREVLSRSGSTRAYVRIPTGMEAGDVLIEGQNWIAVHCRGSDGQHRIDIGLEVMGSD